MRARPHSVAIVGNAPVVADHAAAIDRCDIVVRCNHAVGFGGATGARVSELALINCGGQIEEWLATGAIERSPAFRATSVVRLPIHPQKAGLIVPPLSARELAAAAAQDFTDAAGRRFFDRGKRVKRLSAAFFAASVAALGHAPLRRDSPAPSTGYLLTRWWVGLCARLGVPCHAYNFGFAGWHGHDWAAERRWFAAQARAGRLVLHDDGTGARCAA